MTGIVLAELAALVGLEQYAGEVACALVPLRVMIYLLVAGLMADVARHAAVGYSDLSEWPDYRNLGDRLREAAGFVVALFVAILPAVTLLAWTGCGDRFAVSRTVNGACVGWLGLGLYLGAWLWLPAFLAVALAGELLPSIALLANLRALITAPGDGARTAAICWLGVATGPALRAAVGSTSLAGAAAETILGAYGAIVAARAAGEWARRRAGAGGTVA